MNNLDQLLERACAGDSEAWTAVYKDGIVQRAAKHISRKYGFPEDLREDVAQDAFARIINSNQGYDPQRGSAVTYIFTVVDNTCKDLIRKRTREPKLVSGSAHPYNEPSVNPIKSLENQEEAKVVLEKVIEQTELADGINLIILNEAGLHHKDLSNGLRIPLGTVKTKIFDTKNALRDSRTNYFPE